MASKGKDVLLCIAEEATPNKLPASPVWHVVRWTDHDLKRETTVEKSDSVSTGRYRQGSIPMSATAGGTISFELAAGGATDLFFEGVSFGGSFVPGTPDTLAVGGNVLKTYTLVRKDLKTGKTKIFSGVRIGEMTISGEATGKITGQVTVSATDYTESAVSPVTNPIETNTKFVSAVNTKSFKINGQETVNVACVQSFELSINNNLSEIRCLGSGNLIANAFNEGMVDISLTAKVLLTTTSEQWEDYVLSRVPMTADIGIVDTANNTINFVFPQLEVDAANPNNTTPEDDNTLDLTFTHVRVAPIIQRKLV